MPSIYFNPWIGTKYGRTSCFGVPVLVLGEAHYGPNHPDVEFTTKIVRQFGQRERFAFFTKVAKMLLGRDGHVSLDDATRADFYENVAFYNYVQCFVSDGPRVAPSSDQWTASHSAFLEVVSTFKPEVIVILGRRLSANMTQVPAGIHSCVVMHPSSSHFEYGEWNSEFRKCVQAALAARSS